MGKTRISVFVALLLAFSLLLSNVCIAADSVPDQSDPNAVSVVPSTWTTQDVFFTSGNDTIYGSLIAPQDHNEKVPVAVVVHGMNASTEWCTDVAMSLSNVGVATLNIDLAGFGKSTGETVDATLTSMTDNVLCALHYVEKLEFTDPDHIFLLGKSLGGLVSFLAADQYSGNLAGICVWYPGISVLDNTRRGGLFGSYFNPFQVPDSVDCWSLGMDFQLECYTYGKAFIEECRQLDISPILERQTLPVCIVHGDKDEIVPLGWGFLADSMLPNSKLFIIPGGVHGFFGKPLPLALAVTNGWFLEQLS